MGSGYGSLQLWSGGRPTGSGSLIKPLKNRIRIQWMIRIRWMIRIWSFFIISIDDPDPGPFYCHLKAIPPDPDPWQNHHHSKTGSGSDLSGSGSGSIKDPDPARSGIRIRPDVPRMAAGGIRIRIRSKISRIRPLVQSTRWAGYKSTRSYIIRGYICTRPNGYFCTRKKKLFYLSFKKILVEICFVLDHYKQSLQVISKSAGNQSCCH